MSTEEKERLNNLDSQFNSLIFNEITDAIAEGEIDINEIQQRIRRGLDSAEIKLD